MFEVSHSALDVASTIAAVSHPSAGGIDVFLGAVRDHNDGRLVTRLDYEAYESMAVREMARVGDEIARAMPGVRLAAVHRVGSLAVGDLAIVCAASAPHRAEAFSACRRLIDEIKARVPIWKREWGPDGPYWVGWQDARCAPDHGHDHGHSHGQAHGHDHPREPAPGPAPVAHDAHAAHAAHARAAPVRVVTLTVSDTRTDATDASGDALRAGLAAAGFVLVRHAIVRDEPALVRAQIQQAIDGGEADAVVSTGGTGVASRDQTYEAVASLLEKTLDGFGEAFRRLSWEQVGARAVLSRAVAGTYHGGVVVALPGSPRAVTLGVEKLVVPVLPHAVALARG